MIVENPYEEEVADFLQGIQDPTHKFAHSYRKDARCLQLADEIENA
jgi:excinuclease UvrABC nuclease subunit